MLVVVLLAAGCAKRAVLPPVQGPGPSPYTVNGRTYYPLAQSEGFQEQGLASWYGYPYHGRKTSSGEVYDMHRHTAAHRTLPLGTLVKVTSLANGKVTQVRINDRGPFVQGRIIDLSKAAAEDLGLVQKGTDLVRVEAVGQAAPAAGQTRPAFRLGPFTVQVGAFKNPANARRLLARLNERYGQARAGVVVFNDGESVFYRVRIFQVQTRDQAESFLKRLADHGFGQGFVVAVD